MEFIKTENLSFSYGYKEKLVLKNISLGINKGDFVLLFGKSGSGKSTLIKHLTSLLMPFGKREGKIIYDGIEIEKMSHKEVCKKIGYVSQSPSAQVVTDKVWHELVFTMENLGYDEMTMRTRMAEMTAFFGIEKLIDKNSCELSGGELQKVNLACAMLSLPETLLLDEPVSSLDPVAKGDFLNLLTKINEEYGVTIIMAEHSLSQLLDKVDKCIVMDSGEIIFNGNPKSICNRLYDTETYCDFLPDSIRIGKKFFEVEDAYTVKDAKRLVDAKRPCFINVNRRDASFVDNCILELKNIYFRYSRYDNDILKNLSLKINDGDFLSIIGPNGSGKTTLLSIMAGIHKPYKGKIICKKRIAMLPQDPVSLFIKNTVKEELECINDNYFKLVDELDMKHILDSHPYDLSGGEVELVAIIKTLLANPGVLILDEPTKGMDVINKKKLGHLLKKLNKNGMTIIMVSHDMDFIARYSKNSTILFDKDIIEGNNTHEVMLNNFFYTTDVHKIMRNVSNAITYEEVAINEK